MALRIANNIAAMNTQRWLGVADAGLKKSLERLSSGYRINRAADDAAGLAISQSFRADIASYNVAGRNVSEANSLVQVAEGAMDQIGNMLTRLKELATQASSANAGANLDKINAEGNAIISEIDRIANVTEYAGTKLLAGTFGVTVSAGASMTAGEGFAGASNLESEVTYTVLATAGGTGLVDVTVSATLAAGQISQTITGLTAAEAQNVTFGALGLTIAFNTNFSSASDGDIVANAGTASNFQVGASDSTDDRVGIKLEGVRTTDLDSGLLADQLDSASEAQAFLTVIDDSISALTTQRGNIGATQNRLAYASANLATMIENVQAAESVIRDVDMAAEMTDFTKNQILLQAGTAMLAQANMAPQQVLALFG